MGNKDTVYLADEEDSKKVIGDAILNLWEAVNNLTRLRPRRRPRFRVTVFGSARAQPGTEAYDQTYRLAHKISRLGCDIVTGGGPGLMEAANKGAHQGGRGKKGSIGLNIDIEAEQNVNPFVGQVYTHKTFFSRLHHFVLLSDAFVVVSGGIGTALEVMMVWQLLQVRKIYRTPLILVGPMWKDLVVWARRHMLSGENPRALPVDLAIPHCVDTVDEAYELIKKQRRLWRAKNR